jgi:hypothetical protein
MSNQITQKLESMRIDARIQRSFENINDRMKARMSKLKDYLANFDFEN